MKRLTIMISLAALALAAVPLSPMLAGDAPPAPNPPGDVGPQRLSASFREAARAIAPAVVSIHAQRGPGLSLMPAELFRRAPRGPEQGLGSGVIVRSDGHILTNDHVIRGAADIAVTLADGRRLPARLVGAEPGADLALLKVDASDLPAARFGDSEALEVGDWVLAAGSPFGLSQTVTAGIVSAKARSGIGVADYEAFIQTDAAINPGNSGGPLIDLRGRVVGISTAIASSHGGNLGIGFAIPSRLAERVLAQLLETGEVHKGWLGVVLSDHPTSPRGALVEEVLPGSPAAAAGLRAGDIVTGLGGAPVAHAQDLRARIAYAGPGAELHLELSREGSELTLTVRLGERASALAAPPQAPSAPTAPAELGASGVDLSEDACAALGVPAAVEVVAVKPGSLAAQLGLRPGDVILGLDGAPLTRGVDDLRERITVAALRRGLRLDVRRGPARMQLFLQRR